MPAPLPKPATPKIPTPGTTGTPVPASNQSSVQMVGGKPVSPQANVSAAPRPTLPQTQQPVRQAVSAPAAPTPAVSVPGQLPAKPPVAAGQSPVVTPPKPPVPAAQPPIQQAAASRITQIPQQLPPKAPAIPPTQQKQTPPPGFTPPAPTTAAPGQALVKPPVAGAPTPGPVRPPIAGGSVPGPTAPKPMQPPVRVQQPPQTLTALSSMASNRLPAGSGAAPAPVAAPSTGPQPLTKTPQAPKTAEFVQPKKSILRFLPYILGGGLLLLLIGFVAFRFLGSSSPSSVSNSGSNSSGGTNGTVPAGKQITLEYWGLWEQSDVMEQVIKDYQTKNPGVNIKYTKQSYKDYRTRLQTAVNSGNGPDIFRFHATWTPMLKQELSPIPSAIMSTTEFQSTFYPIAVQQLQQGGQLVGIPLMYDGLVLYYNTDIFKTAVLEPPKTWADLRATAAKLTLTTDGTAHGPVKRGGIALGNSTNVDHFSDILGVLMLQNNADMTKPSSVEVHDALLFYTNFIKTDNVWNDTLPSSTIAFARGDAAMMFAPSWRAFDIKATNPDLHFATVPLPQLSDKRTAWGTYWAEGVSSKSKNKDEAWKFLKYLSSKDVQQKLVSSQAQTRAFGEIYSRKDLADTLAQDPVLASFVQDAPYAQGWSMSSFTHDDGLNDQIIQYYKDAVTAILEGKPVEEVQKTLDQGVSQVLRQYGVTNQSSSGTTTQP